MKKTKFEKNFLEDEIVEKHLFIEDNFRKIKKKLIFEIAFARIQEISQIMLEKNINIGHYKKYSNKLFLEITSELQTESLINIFKGCFSEDSEIEVKILNSFTSGDMLKTANEIVHFGWKKEAIPITQSKKSLIVRFFDTIFG